MIFKKSRLQAFLFLFLVNAAVVSAQEDKPNPIVGRWDLTMTMDGEERPSWLEISKSGKSLVGRFVFAFGSARPVSEIKMDGELFSFSIPPQYEPGEDDMAFEGTYVGETLKGNMRYTDGKTYDWVGTRAPKLSYNANPNWGKPIDLFNGKDLSGWESQGEGEWLAEDGLLKNAKPGANLLTTDTFKDFKLEVEFRYPEGSNSGIYLRGRYEVQIADNKGLEPNSLLFGGIYGFLTPNEMAAKNPGEWQQYEITLIGRRVTVVANGKAIIVDQNIPGITGGAIDSKEGEPGPLLIQGDHGPIEFRKIVLTPAMD
ncbi:3-keto-disaccharide hydrolase [Poritiphilus flavus]|uniref:DUF1080 domain-containing protein n=1 Tax=Poritiphilus flavus TaxID=2697053 RepID=A0A6L9ECD0_9FLAO|nr:DUF1080 domain-containing protein [Poritiphilus flavus]NAS12400.1 DUF1080 domain-containing protein [Poritiphilus flavus]